MKILVATKNRGKFKEICEILCTLNADFVSLKDLGITEDFPEEGSSFEENALEKARFYSKLSNLPAVADDSGIFVEALEGELGTKTRRYGAGEKASDREWLTYFMRRMSKEKNRKAKFVCAAAFVGSMIEKVFLGESEGIIEETVQVPVEAGIPLSSVFKPNGYEHVFSALSTEEKNRVSHRGKAFQKLLQLLLDEYF